MADRTAAVREEAHENSATGEPPDVPQAVVDEINVVRRDPRGYAEELALLGRTGAAGSTAQLKECLRDLRSAAPMPELTLSQAICRACREHLADMRASGRFSHLGADGSTPEARLSRVGDHREQCGENVAVGAGSAKEVVHHMLIEDASVEHGQRANLLNPDFRFAGAAHAEHPTSGSVTVLLLTDHFKAKKASHADIQRGILEDVGSQAKTTNGAAGGSNEATQRSWDELMQQAKPDHLQVPAERRSHVEFMASPKLYGEPKVKVPQFPLGDLQPRPGVDPAIVRAFIHRTDGDNDDLVTEEDLKAVCQRKQLGISSTELAQMFDEILQRRRSGEQDRRAVDYAELCAAMQPQKRWAPVMDIHVERGTDAYQLIVDSEVFARWRRELHDEFAGRCEGLVSPTSHAESRGSRNGSAGVRAEEVNSFLASVLGATLQEAGTPLQREPQVQQLLGRPGRGADAAQEIRSAVCLGQRRLWAYHLRPHREAWLWLFRALDLHPLTSDGSAEQVPQAGASQLRPKNVARTPPRYYGIPAGAEKMTIRDAPEKIKVRADKTSNPAGTRKIGPWQERQIESSVNNCITSEGGVDGSMTSPCVGFQAQRKFAQVLYMQKHGISMNEAHQHQLDSQPDALDRELDDSGGSRRGLGGSAPPAGHRGHGAGSHSLMARGGVRSHFHNSAAIHARDGGHGGLSALDVRWEGAHIDHTRLPAVKGPALEEQRLGRNSETAGPQDCAALKARTASSCARDAEPYREWTQYEFRSDVPHRHGKHGRRHFDPQVREKPMNNRHFVSEIENKPQEEYERHAERVHEYLHRKMPRGQDRHFQPYLPRSQQPLKYEELATGQAVRSAVAGGVVKRNALGFGQMRHSGPGDPQLCTRPLGASQMDRLIPLA